jgi:hypothetical protein
MKKVYNVESVPSVQRLSELLNENIRRIDPNLKTEIENVLDGIVKLDQEVKQKTFEVQSKDNVIIQKDNDINLKTWEIIGKDNLINLKECEIASKDGFINQLADKIIEDANVVNLKDWKLGQKDQEIVRLTELLTLKEVETQNKEQVILENNELLLAKELEKQELARQKEIEKQELLAQKELETKEMLAQKELEKQELIRQKEIEKEELMAQKESELANKSLVKNQVISGLKSDIDSQEKEAFKLQIELLRKELEFSKKQLELKDKEVELKDKALEDAHEITKQNKIINELQGKLLDLKALYGHDISFAEEFSAIQFRAENSILNNDFGDIANLSRYISELLASEREDSLSLDISTLLANISPIPHPVAVNNASNFDIENQHITHSVLLSGDEVSIISEENFN